MARKADKKIEQAETKRTPAWAPWAGLAARVTVGLVLVISGLMKAAAPVEEFAVVIESYHMVSPSAALSLAGILPWIEIVLGFSLLCGFMMNWSSRMVIGLFLAFIFVLVRVKLKGIVLPNCGCFGSAIHMTPLQAIAFDSVLVAAAFLSAKFGALKLSLDGWTKAGTA